MDNGYLNHVVLLMHSTLRLEYIAILVFLLVGLLFCPLREHVQLFFLPYSSTPRK